MSHAPLPIKIHLSMKGGPELHLCPGGREGDEDDQSENTSISPQQIKKTTDKVEGEEDDQSSNFYLKKMNIIKIIHILPLDEDRFSKDFLKSYILLTLFMYY
jgi:hypothetical protein